MEPREQPLRLGPRGRIWFDRLLVGVLVLMAAVSASTDWPAALLSVAQIVPLWWRRRYPVATFAAVAILSAAQILVVDVPILGQLAFPIAVYSVARYATGRAGLWALAVGFVGAWVATFVWLHGWGDLGADAVAAYVVTIVAIVLSAWALGTLGRTRQAYVDTLEERNTRLHREAEQRAELAAAEERARIAREMHDVVSHGLSTIVVQADGGRYAARSDPEAAQTALTTIADAARGALAEMRGMLGLLRAGDDRSVRPQPGLNDLPALVAETREAGTRVTARLPTAPVERVPDGPALTAYRVVQEALSNVRRHAGPEASVTLTLRVAESIEIEVADDGHGAASRSDDRGLGLVGMRERVEAHGGSVEAGPRAGGGFAVAARIPL